MFQTNSAYMLFYERISTEVLKAEEETAKTSQDALDEVEDQPKYKVDLSEDLADVSIVVWLLCLQCSYRKLRYPAIARNFINLFKLKLKKTLKYLWVIFSPNLINIGSLM